MDSWDVFTWLCGFCFQKGFMEKGNGSEHPGGYYHGNEDGLKEMTNWATPFLVVYKLKSCFTNVFIKDTVMLYQQEKLCFQIK
jgi:hypothetical protein